MVNPYEIIKKKSKEMENPVPGSSLTVDAAVHQKVKEQFKETTSKLAALQEAILVDILQKSMIGPDAWPAAAGSAETLEVALKAAEAIPAMDGERLKADLFQAREKIAVLTSEIEQLRLMNRREGKGAQLLGVDRARTLPLEEEVKALQGELAKKAKAINVLELELMELRHEIARNASPGDPLVARSELMNDHRNRTMEAENELQMERRALNKEYLRLMREDEERVTHFRALEQQLHANLERAANEWEDFLSSWHRDTFQVREALVATMQQVRTAAVEADKQREAMLQEILAGVLSEAEQHKSLLKAEMALQSAKVAKENQESANTLQERIQRMQEESQMARDSAARLSEERDVSLAQSGIEHRRALEVKDTEAEATKTQLESTIKRLRDNLSDSREETRCVRAQMQIESDVLQRTIRELQGEISAERTAFSEKECKWIAELERCSADAANARRDEGLRLLTMKEEMNAAVRHEVEAFKRQYLELHHAAKHGVSEPIPAESFSETSLRLRVHRMRDWTWATTQHYVQNQTQQVFSPNPVTARSASALTDVSRSISPLTAVSTTVPSEIRRRPPSDTYHKMQNLAEQVRGRISIVGQNTAAALPERM